MGGAALYRCFAIGGLLDSCPLTEATCVADCDGAIRVKLRVSSAVELVRPPDLVPALWSIGVPVRSAR